MQTPHSRKQPIIPVAKNLEAQNTNLEAGFDIVAVIIYLSCVTLLKSCNFQQKTGTLKWLRMSAAASRGNWPHDDDKVNISLYMMIVRCKHKST